MKKNYFPSYISLKMSDVAPAPRPCAALERFSSTSSLNALRALVVLRTTVISSSIDLHSGNGENLSRFLSIKIKRRCLFLNLQ